MSNVSSGTVYYYAEDMLGSSRTDPPGSTSRRPGRPHSVQAGQTTPCYDADFYPFGGERVVTNTCSQNYKFEGKERDTETGNDDFGARYYSSRMGRWLSADWSSVPVPVPYANLTNPQTLNLYAMVSDNPETFADLDGHQNGSSGGTTCAAAATLGTLATCQASTTAPPPPGGKDPNPNNGTGTPPSTTQQAQNENLVQTISNGIGAAITNTLVDTLNLGNEIAAKVSGAAPPAEIPDIKPGTPGEKAVSDVANLGMLFLPESKAADLEKVGVVLREEEIAKAGEQVAEYSESALKSSARKATAQIEKHLNILKSATERQIRSIKVDLRHNGERLEAIIREIAGRGSQ
jgi:RHS repeat-associated protein